MSSPTVTLMMEGASMDEAERCRGLIHTLMRTGVFAVKGGSVILHFDGVGALRKIEKNYVAYQK